MNTYTRASLVADSLSLGSHWIYNQAKLARVFPDGVTEFTDPASNYHPNRSAGEFTHYGDQTRWLADLSEEQGGFELDAWRDRWLEAMKAYDGYVDGASSETIASEGRKPSRSNDIAGASRIGPVLDLDLPIEETVAAARAQAALTHGDPSVADAAEFFARAVRAIEEGATFREGFDRAASEGSYDAIDPGEAIQVAASKDPEAFLEVGTQLGLTCHMPEAFPLTLYFALRPGAEFRSTLSDNAMAGGDTSARAMLLALLFAAADESTGSDLAGQLKSGSTARPEPLEPGSHRVDLEGSSGTLSGVLEVPDGTPRAFAIFAHCFTCGKDFLPGARITRSLAEHGIATLRIDFAGIGKSEGDFSDSSFLTNLDDLVVAAGWLRDRHEAPRLLVGHSLGGAAVLAAAASIEEVKAVATIGAPYLPEHVTHLFEGHLDEIRQDGEAEVKLAGRSFLVGKKFLDDLERHNHQDLLGELRGIDTLILHSPTDKVVSIDNAGHIYSALRHPKSFISLAGADHLLTDETDTRYVSNLIATWAERALGS